MIHELNKTLEKVNKTVGVDIKLPMPTKKSLSYASIFTATVGTALVVAGIVASSKLMTVAGGVSIVSSIIQKIESNKIDR